MAFSRGGRSLRNIFASNLTNTFIGSESSVFISATYSFTTLELENSATNSSIAFGNIEQKSANQDVYSITYTITTNDVDKTFIVILPDTDDVSDGYKLTIINTLSYKLSVRVKNINFDIISSWTLTGIPLDVPTNREADSDGIYIVLPPHMSITLTYANNTWYSSI